MFLVELFIVLLRFGWARALVVSALGLPAAWAC